MKKLSKFLSLLMAMAFFATIAFAGITKTEIDGLLKLADTLTPKWVKEAYKKANPTAQAIPVFANKRPFAVSIALMGPAILEQFRESNDPTPLHINDDMLAISYIVGDFILDIANHVLPRIPFYKKKIKAYRENGIVEAVKDALNDELQKLTEDELSFDEKKALKNNLDIDLQLIEGEANRQRAIDLRLTGLLEPEGLNIRQRGLYPNDIGVNQISLDTHGNVAQIILSMIIHDSREGSCTSGHKCKDRTIYTKIYTPDSVEVIKLLEEGVTIPKDKWKNRSFSYDLGEVGKEKIDSRLYCSEEKLAQQRENQEDKAAQNVLEVSVVSQEKCDGEYLESGICLRQCHDSYAADDEHVPDIDALVRYYFYSTIGAEADQRDKKIVQIRQVLSQN